MMNTRWNSNVLVLMLLLVGCTTPPVQRVALLAPFEGQYREIGYQALYAARMAIAEADRNHLELIAIDDGGTLATAQDRVRALNNDPLMTGVLLLGPHPTHEITIALLDDDLAHIIIGDWTDDFETVGTATTPTSCADLCGLTVFTANATGLNQLTIQTVAPPVTEKFAARYAAFDTFAPPPLPLAHLTYQITAAWLRGEVLPTNSYTYRYTVDGQLIPTDVD